MADEMRTREAQSGCEEGYRSVRIRNTQERKRDFHKEGQFSPGTALLSVIAYNKAEQ